MGARIVIVVILTLLCLIVYFLYKRGKLGKLATIGAALVISIAFVSNLLQQITFIWPDLDIPSNAPLIAITGTPSIIASTPQRTSSAFTPTTTKDTPLPTVPFTTTTATEFEMNQLASVASGSVHQVAWSPDNSMLAVALFKDAIVKIYSPDLNLIRQCKGHTEGVRSVTFSPDGSTLASGGSDATVRLWVWSGANCR